MEQPEQQLQRAWNNTNCKTDVSKAQMYYYGTKQEAEQFSEKLRLLARDNN